MTEKEKLENIHIRVTSTHRKWLEKLVDNGDYSSISEVIRDSIRLLRQEKQEVNK